MSNYSIQGVHALNRWIWARLSQKMPNEFAAYLTGTGPLVNLVPVIPYQQIPQFNDISGGAPFIVYTYNINSTGEEFWMNSEQIVYTVFDNNESRLRGIQGFLVQLLSRMDWSAREANDFDDQSSIYFKYITVNSANSPGPFTSEGGRQGASVIVTIVYTRDIDQTGMRL